MEDYDFSEILEELNGTDEDDSPDAEDREAARHSSGRTYDEGIPRQKRKRKKRLAAA